MDLRLDSLLARLEIGLAENQKMRLIFTILLLIMNTPLFARVTINGEECIPVSEGYESVLYKIANCAAYHIHKNGSVPESDKTLILRMRRDFKIPDTLYKQAVLNHIDDFQAEGNLLITPEEQLNWGLENCELIRKYDLIQ